MPVDPVTISFSNEAAKSAISIIVKDLYGLAKTKTASLYNRFAATWKIQTVCKNLSSVRKVKTIFQLEKDVDIKHFYYTSRIRIGKEPKSISSLSDIPFDGNIVIEGTVGQGKSTFLRYLTWAEATKGKAIPLFIELRKYDAKEDAIKLIQSQLVTFGLPTDEDVLVFLLDSGKIWLFLDGFDEIADRNRSSVVTALESLATRFPNTRMIITSRPDSDIQSSAFFRVLALCPLRPGEYKQLIRRMCTNASIADRLINQTETADQLASDGRSITGLLNTPLMVALLLVKFNIEQSVPENLCDFYRELFILLLQRHDKSKAGFRRERQSKLSDDDIQAVFDSLCFQMRKDGLSAISKTRLRLVLKSICEDEDLTADSACVLSDITKITCLLLEDGGEFHFVHRSVLEFHAARHVASQPEEHASIFYDTVQPIWHLWLEEINFLSELDPYRFHKFFEMPDIENVLEKLGSKKPHIKSSNELRLFTGDLEGELKIAPDQKFTRWIRVSPQSTWTGFKAFGRRWQSLVGPLGKAILTKTIIEDAKKKTQSWTRVFLWKHSADSEPPLILNVCGLLDAGRLDYKIFQSLESEVDCLRERLAILKRQVKTKESKKTRFDFNQNGNGKKH
ncbi:NACHT domain-containing protein [bacterium]|nr:NACHT domain-containing protein [bacterium]